MDSKEKERGKDIMWYIWLSENSPLFGKDKMATFERYFLAEKETHKEVKNPYYDMLENEEVLDRILREFGLEPEGAHIINGHVPVKSKDGESRSNAAVSFSSSTVVSQGISERNRYRGVYADLQLLRSDSGSARSV